MDRGHGAADGRHAPRRARGSSSSPRTAGRRPGASSRSGTVGSASDGLVATTFRLTARPADANPDAAPGAATLVGTEGRPVAVRDGVATTVDLTVMRGAVLRGRVEDAATGAPLAGVEVLATLDGASATGGRTTASATSAADGTFELAGLASGRWVVEA